MLVPSAASTAAARAVNGTQTPTSTSPAAPSTRPRTSSRYERASAAVLCIFQLPAMYGRRSCSGIVERLHSGQLLALQQLQGGAPARGEVRDAVGQAELGERRGAVPAADHRGSGRGRDGLGERARSGGERLELEGAHGSVPE